MKNVLIVTGSDFTMQGYQALFQLKEEGYKIHLLTDGLFSPAHALFERIFVAPLQTTKDTIEYMKRQSVRFDAVVTIYSDWLTTLVALLAKEYGCLGNRPAVAFACRSKYHMRKIMSERGVPIPQFKLCRNYEEVKKAVDQIGIPCVVKPIGGHASCGIFMVRNTEDRHALEENFQKSLRYLTTKEGEVFFDYSDDDLRLMDVSSTVNMATDYLVEEYLQGPSISVDALVQKGKITLMGMEDQIRMKPPYFIQTAARFPYLCTPERKEQITQLVRKTIDAMGIQNSATHTEMIFTPDGPKIVEIGCRMGGDNIHDDLFYATGYRMLYEIVMTALGEQRTYEFKPLKHNAMKYYLPEKNGVVRDILISPELKTNPAVHELSLSVKPGDRVARPPEGFDCLGHISVHGDTPEEAWKILEESCPGIQFIID